MYIYLYPKKYYSASCAKFITTIITKKFVCFVISGYLQIPAIIPQTKHHRLKHMLPHRTISLQLTQ